MTIAVGARLPDVTFLLPSADGPVAKTTADLFSGKTVALFGVPGAFTPTCHRNHLPGFIDKASDFKTKGVDAIYCTSVNDPFVMKAWGEATGATGAVEMLADGAGAFAKAIGLSVDLSERGFGLRSQRYSMLVKDGVVTSLNIEEKPGAAEISGADALLAKI
jgi:glutaredoxin/glutathione-dependent peroxiredoxin